MTSGGRRRIEALFEAAIELPPEERPDFVAREAAGDEALREGVEALLRAHGRAGGVLDGPPRGDAASLLAEAGGGRGRGGSTGTGVELGERIGPYRLLDEIGRGGMGVVYLAERDDGHFRRRVAIKVLRPDGDEELPARMIAERQILASLDHPAIAKLLDGGVTRDGRPYLVMEHVAGLPVDTYCDRMRLSLRERLRLFLTVVRAVEHAHQNLVVHRDLKPSNVLVTTDGSVKLLDFGIAKLLNPSIAGVEAPVTRAERRVMTPEYASPEQLRGETLTTVSDVYSLGVVLYRLLTGLPPYRLSGGGVPAVLTAVLAGDPDPPSQRIAARIAAAPGSGAADVASDPGEIAHARSTTPERLRRALAGDLDAVVMKALRREPAARFGSAELLARDVEAYLAGEPVSARRGSRWYRVRKLALRHRTGAVAAAAVALSLLLGAAAAAWQARIAGRERDRVAAALAETERALAQSSAVTEFLVDLFRAGDPSAGGGEVTARDLLRRGTERADALSGQPAVRGLMLDVIGEMHYRLGNYDEAEILLSRAVDLRRRELGPDHPDVAESLIHLARVTRSTAGTATAEPLVEEALRIRRSALPPNDPRVAEALHELGWLRWGEEQERLYREALAVYRASGTELRRQAEIMHGLSTNLRRQGRLEEAVATDREALAFARRTLGPQHPATAYAMIHLADHVRDIERDLDEAERLYRAGLEIQERREGASSLALIHGLHSLAELTSRRGEHAEAEALVRRALATRLAATGPEHPGVAGEKALLARHLARRGRVAEAGRLATEALEHFERAFGRSHPSYAGALTTLADVAVARGDREEAERLLRRAIDLRVAAGEGGVPLAERHRTLGRLLTGSGRFDEAERELRRSLELMEEAFDGAPHPNLTESRRALHELYVRWGRPERAARFQVPPGEFVSY